MSGGGGDDYAKQQSVVEKNKQKARDALNISFGVAPSAAAAPDIADFTKTVGSGTGAYNSTGQWVPSQTTSIVTDQDAYQAALDAFNNAGSDAAKNKTARDALYSGVRDNAFTAGKRGLDENKDRAARDLKFALFGQGLNGGSVDVDQNATLGRTYDQGLLSLGAKADAAKSDLNSNDEATRLGLLQSIDAGMDQGSAVSSAINQLKINNDKAAASAQGTSLGDLFADAGLLYSKSNAARGAADATNYYNANGGTSFRSKPVGGIVTRTGG